MSTRNTFLLPNVRSKVHILWMRQVLSLYKKLFRDVAREVCSYITREPLALVGGEVLRFNCTSLAWESLYQLAGTTVDPTAAYTLIRENRFLVCGGEETLISHNRVINVNEGVVSEVVGMGLPRSCAAAYYLQTSHCVLIFGGRRTGERHTHFYCESEKFSLRDEVWQPIQSMAKARRDFNVCEYLAALYLCGGYNPYVEVYIELTDSMTRLQCCFLPENSPSIAAVFGKVLVVVTEGFVFQWDLCGKKKKACLSRNTTPLNSRTPAVVYGKAVYVCTTGVKCIKIEIGDMRQ